MCSILFNLVSKEHYFVLIKYSSQNRTPQGSGSEPFQSCVPLCSRMRCHIPLINWSLILYYILSISESKQLRKILKKILNIIYVNYLGHFMNTEPYNGFPNQDQLEFDHWHYRTPPTISVWIIHGLICFILFPTTNLEAYFRYCEKYGDFPLKINVK